jgi:hypothetical protein
MTLVTDPHTIEGGVPAEDVIRAPGSRPRNPLQARGQVPQLLSGRGPRTRSSVLSRPTSPKPRTPSTGKLTV